MDSPPGGARRNGPRLAAIAIAAFALAASAAGCARDAATHAGAPPRVPADSAGLARLLPESDDSQLVVFYGAELMGSITGCGCFGRPEQGSVAYRFGYTEGFRARFPETAILQVDAGHSLEAVRGRDGAVLPDLQAKAEWAVRAFDRLGLDAANVTHHEIEYLAPSLRAGEREKLVAETPMLGRYVSANVEPVGPGLAAPPAFVVRELAGARLPSGRVRVAVVGVTEDGAAFGRNGFRASDPAEALARALPRARAESDFVVLLAYLPPERALEVARGQASAPDVVIVAHPLARSAEASLDAAPRLAYARYKTERLGELSLRLGGGAVAGARNRYVTLDEPLPKDPLAAQIASEADAAIRQARLARFESAGQRRE